MSKANDMRMMQLAVIAAFAALSLVPRSFAQAPKPLQTNGDLATVEDALRQSAAGTTIPLSSYTVDHGKGKGPYKGVIVGGDPFSARPRPVTIDVVVIPLPIEIVTKDGHHVVFDPSIATACDGGVSAVDRLKHSPLVVSKDYVVNGVDVGRVQYINGIMRAEFWNATENSKLLDDSLRWTFAAPATLPPFPPGMGIVEGNVHEGKGCGARGLVTQSVLVNFIKGFLVPALQSQGVISPKKLAFFLLRDVVTSPTAPPVKEGEGGAHSASGSPLQTYAWAPYLTNTLDAAAGKRDIHSISHEIGEWMNDPFAGVSPNRTPKWSAPNSTKCKGSLEVGDPIEGQVKTIEMDGYTYHPQELAFFSWFFNAKSVPSIGAGGKFSSNGHLAGPAQPCPPGGTYR